MKKLPELYKNLNSKPKDNNKKVYYMENDIRSAEKNIIEKCSKNYNWYIHIITNLVMNEFINLYS